MKPVSLALAALVALPFVFASPHRLRHSLQRRAAEGADCSVDACDDGLECSGGICITSGGGGDECGGTCTSDQTCNAGVCESIGGGSDCNPVCSDGETCNAGTCEPVTTTCDPACADGETCNAGTCEPSTTCDPACTDGFTCNTATLTCDPITTCDPVCTDGFTCNTATLTCDPITTCDPVCTDGQTCNLETYVCEPTGCNPACTDGFTCNTATLACDPITTCDPTCADGEICDAGTCKQISCDPACADGETCNAGSCEASTTTLISNGGPCNGDNSDADCESGYCFEGTCTAVTDITGRADPTHCVSSDNCQSDSPCSEGYCTKLTDSNKNTGVTVTVTETTAGQSYIYTAVVIKESTRTLTVVAPGAVRTPVKSVGGGKVQPKVSNSTSKTSSVRPSATAKASSAAERGVVVVSAFGGGVLAFAFYLLA